MKEVTDSFQVYTLNSKFFLVFPVNSKQGLVYFQETKWKLFC